MSVDDIRRRIDAIDDELLELLEQRARLAKRIAEEKHKVGQAMHDPERERAVLRRVEEKAAARKDSIFPTSGLRAIFREIMSSCLSLEEPQTVAYLGPEGTFSHIAARTAFGNGARYVALPTIGAVVEAVARDTVTYGIAPIENSTEGSVTATLDAILESDIMIRGELVIPVEHCLLAKTTDFSAIRRVYSHPQPLAQCRGWLARHLPHAELLATSSTVTAAKEAANDETAAAIGSRVSAELYDLLLLREGIQDRPENATRFFVLAKQDAPHGENNKTSLVFSTPHARGALRRALEVFDDEGLNLTRIESRPAPGRRWEYVFVTELEGHRLDTPVQRALDRLRSICSMVRVLGSFPRNE